jgi:hypothetical protein
MLGERRAVVVQLRPVDVHGVRYADLTVAYPDRSLDSARLGIESLPDDLREGEQVLVSTAVNMIVAVRRLES